MIFNKKPTFEQHDNEKDSYYKSSIKDYIKTDTFESDLDVDICVVGGGITGISSALYLAKKGYSVALFEARKIGWGASGRNGGHLGIGMRKDQKFIENKLGFDHALELWKIGLEAVEEAKKLINEHKIDCSIKRGIIHAGYYKSDEFDFLEDINHMQKYYNFDGYKFLDREKIHEEIKTNIYHSGLLNTYSYHINPLKFLMGLAMELKKFNVKIFENTPIIKLENNKKGVKLYSATNFTFAKKVIVGCNGYLDNLLGGVRNKFMPINNYIIATEPIGEGKAREIIKNNYAVSDTRFIIDYYRFSEDWRMLFGGGETYSGKFLKNSKNFVAKRMHKVFPLLKKYKIEYSWGGTLAITINRLPSFGTLMNDKVIYAHGYSGHGLALSLIAGKLIYEKISGKSERFNFLSSVKNYSIPGGDFLRRPIYTSAVAFYKFKDTINLFSK